MFVDIKEYPGYKINENGIVINKKGHVLRPAISNAGYLRVSLETYDENGKLVKRENKSIHRLVAENFISNPNNLPVVMHKDDDPLHCHITNLKWGTQSDNMRQAFDEGRKVSPNLNNHEKYIYYVYNDDKSDINKCKGCEGVAELIGFSNSKHIRPGIIKSGPYKDYTIENSHIRCKCPIKFDYKK